MRRLSWDESQKHYLALHEIEEKYSLDEIRGKVSNAYKKRTEAKIYNERLEYLSQKGLVERLGGFYEVSNTDDQQRSV